MSKKYLYNVDIRWSEEDQVFIARVPELTGVVTLPVFQAIAGYAGLMVSIDELVVLSHRLANTAARNNNYEAILRIINDCMGGRAEGIEREG